MTAIFKHDRKLTVKLNKLVHCSHLVYLGVYEIPFILQAFHSYDSPDFKEVSTLCFYLNSTIIAAGNLVCMGWLSHILSIMSKLKKTKKPKIVLSLLIFFQGASFLGEVTSTLYAWITGSAFMAVSYQNTGSVLIKTEQMESLGAFQRFIYKNGGFSVLAMKMAMREILPIMLFLWLIATRKRDGYFKIKKLES